jgi:probable phosphoglycerate mutase
VTTFLLVRHALCDPVGTRLSGRAPGVSLNEEGRRQASRLAESLAAVKLDALYSSPLERAWETAQAIAARTQVDVQVSPALIEIDFGRWTGSSFEFLDDDITWRRFNTFRTGTRAPGGEHILEAQARAVAEIERLRERHAEQTVAVVSHGDVLRAIIAYYVGLPLDLLSRLTVDPASVSTLEITEDAPRLVRLNVVAS